MGALVIASLGSNLGNREQHLRSAIQHIHAKAGTIEAISEWYETPPLGFESDDQFINLCVAFRSRLDPQVLLETLQSIEIELGRTEKSKNAIYSSRIIDIDILFYADLQIDTKTLVIPHAKYAERKFVLLPLKDLYQKLNQPENVKVTLELIEKCADSSDLKKYIPTKSVDL